MANDFEDHCWKDVIAPDVLDIYADYRRRIYVGPRPALLAVDLYELVYRGGAEPPVAGPGIGAPVDRVVGVPPVRLERPPVDLSRSIRGASS